MSLWQFLQSGKIKRKTRTLLCKQWMIGVLATILQCKAILGRGQPGRMRWILLRIMHLAQDSASTHVIEWVYEHCLSSTNTTETNIIKEIIATDMLWIFSTRKAVRLVSAHEQIYMSQENLVLNISRTWSTRCTSCWPAVHGAATVVQLPLNDQYNWNSSPIVHTMVTLKSDCFELHPFPR